MSEQSDYYQYLQLQTEIQGHALSAFTRPALGQWRDRWIAAQLLAEWAHLDDDARVLHMHCAEGLVGAALAKRFPGARITLLDNHIAAVESAQRTMAANGVTTAEVALSDCAQAVQDRTYDCIVSLLPKSRAVWEQTIRDAAQRIAPGGDIYLAGCNRGGIKSAAKFVDSLFEETVVMAYKGGCRVIRAAQVRQTEDRESDYYQWRTIHAQVGEERLEYVTKPGLFSWQHLDDGTRTLIEVLIGHALQPRDQVLDIGCGSGVLSVLAARQAHAGHITALDADCRAVEATRRTFARNGIEHGEVLLSDCGWAVRDRSFDVVLTNPPFHQEQATAYAVARQIIHDAHHLLEKRGRLYLVANAFLKYEPIIEDTFGNIDVLRRTNRFKVLHAVKYS